MGMEKGSNPAIDRPAMCYRTIDRPASGGDPSLWPDDAEDLE